MASLTQWTWVWADSRSWWWTGKPDMLQSIGPQSDTTEQLNWTELNWYQILGWSKSLFGFSVSCYGKTQTNFSTNPITRRHTHPSFLKICNHKNESLNYRDGKGKRYGFFVSHPTSRKCWKMKSNSIIFFYVDTFLFHNSCFIMKFCSLEHFPEKKNHINT